MRNLVGAARRAYNRRIVRLVASLLSRERVQDPENFRLWESLGYHITLADFLSPIPDTRDIEARDLRPSACHGIDLRPEFQLRLMKESFAPLAPEYNALPVQATDSRTFHLDNPSFGGVDPHVYYCMIRYFRPQKIVEVGSGDSTLLGVQACRANGPTQYVCIDPYPREVTSQGLPGIELIRRKVEDFDLDIFLELRENDILFVDGSHAVRTGGDVCFVVLEVLPRLAPGVIVHFHDIFLPFDYPKEWILLEHRFWAEQYLLQAYLADNSQAEVLFATHFIASRYPDQVRATFPQALWIGGGSFWLRKRCS